jgi:hypothetical protein
MKLLRDQNIRVFKNKWHGKRRDVRDLSERFLEQQHHRFIFWRHARLATHSEGTSGALWIDIKGNTLFFAVVNQFLWSPENHMAALRGCWARYFLIRHRYLL